MPPTTEAGQTGILHFAQWTGVQAAFACRIGVLCCVLLLANPNMAPALMSSGPYRDAKIVVLPADASGLQVESYTRQAVDLEKLLMRVFGDDKRIEVVGVEESNRQLETLGRDQAVPCLSLDCMDAVGEALGAELVVAAELRHTPRMGRTMWDIRVVDTSLDRVVMHDVGAVQGAKVPLDLIRKRIERIAGELLNERGMLIIDTVPPASAVLLNGEPVGFAPVEIERPGGLVDTITAVRHGFVEKSLATKIASGEQRNVMIELQREELNIERTFPLMYAWAIIGQPLDQVGENLDGRLSWGEGQSYGARFDVGSIWRIGLGFYIYDSKLNDVDSQILFDGGVESDPAAFATSIHSSLSYLPSGDPISPMIGLGLAATQRSITVPFPDGDETRSTSFEIGWTFSVGADAKIYGPLRAQLELLHVRTLSEGESWRNDGEALDDQEQAVWIAAFNDFRSWSILRLGIGLTF